jgi:nicotinamidase-related amidase
MKVLLVIDLQAEFKDALSNKRVMDNCAALIDQAKKDGDYVILVNIEHCGAPSVRFTRMIKNYSKGRFLTKYGSSGGIVVNRFLKKHKIRPEEIVVCGCYIEQCVYATVKTLLEYGYNVRVVKKACYSPSYVNGPWVDYKDLPQNQLRVK